MPAHWPVLTAPCWRTTIVVTDAEFLAKKTELLARY
jgi:hypothetical protein